MRLPLFSQLEVFGKISDSLKRSGVTSVWGIAGVGKSTLVRDRYYARMQECSFAGKFAYVDVPDPFDLVEFSRLLLLDFHRCDLEAMEAAAIGIIQGQDPIQGCREILRQDGYLVIIDGLQFTYDWDLIETVFLSPITTESIIVVITTEESIAKHCVKQQVDRVINIKCLEDDVANSAFEQTIDPKELASLRGKVDLAKLVVRCGGLLKVVSAIGKVSGSFLEHMNDDFMFKLETDPRFHCLNGLLSWMHSYFDACSDLVKPCIFYLSVFPASSKIRQWRLVRRWIAEGYSSNRPGCTARENAQKRLSELAELSIIQQASSKGNWQVNSFFREYIISRPMEDNLVFALDGRCSPNTQRAGQHLTIMTDWHRDQTVFESIDLARLRSLTVFGTWCSFFISDKMKRLRVLDLEDVIGVTNGDIEQIFVELLSLKFISLRGCRYISRLPDALGGLRQLQTLDVRFTSIVKLPSAIIKLHKLQYIRAGAIVLPDEDWKSASTEDEVEARDSSISSGRPAVPTCTENGIAESPAQATTSQEAQHRPMLPKVGRLASKLSHTWSFCGSKPRKEVQHHNGGVGVPVGIESLTALHTVGVVNVNASGGEAFLKHLAKLTQLLKLRVCGINKKNWQLLCCALSDHGHLESLSVQFDEDCLDDSFRPPKTLKSLKLYGPMTGLPEVTMKVLVNLIKLDLEMTITSPDDMQLFLKDKLPRHDILNRLCIKVQGDKAVNFSSSEFKYGDWSGCFRPRVVKIDCSSKLEVTFGVNIMKSAEVLIIQCSEGSFFRVSGGHDGLSHLYHLKTVWLKGSYSQEQRQHLQELVDRHSNEMGNGSVRRTG
ncbi:disease resistance protein Pik-2-like [Triticum aestivum]|uniref:disease resistance protein Pik-2-like n=1 Tax=Triticum aestivum TaxID=4565 RepID=UPI001D016AE7|nr:disease resistance protein Pik-2-like [Triticum aestivum]